MIRTYLLHMKTFEYDEVVQNNPPTRSLLSIFRKQKSEPLQPEPIQKPILTKIKLPPKPIENNFTFKSELISEDILIKYGLSQPSKPVTITHKKDIINPEPKPEPQKPIPTLAPVPLIEKTVKKRNWLKLVNIIIGSISIITCAYGAILINNELTGHPTVVAGILSISISSGIITSLIRGL